MARVRQGGLTLLRALLRDAASAAPAPPSAAASGLVSGGTHVAWRVAPTLPYGQVARALAGSCAATSGAAAASTSTSSPAWQVLRRGIGRLMQSSSTTAARTSGVAGGPRGVSWCTEGAGAAAGGAAGARAAGLGARAAALGQVAVAGGGRGVAVRQLRSAWTDSKGHVHSLDHGTAQSVDLTPLARKLLVLLLGGAGLAAYVSCLDTVPYTGRRHRVSAAMEQRVMWKGRRFFEEQKTLARAEGRLLPDNHPDAQRVRRLGARIVAVAADGAGGGYTKHMQDLEWEFVVFDEPTVCATANPVGKVVVYTGMLRVLGNSDDELAALLAHEVAHVLARHSAEDMSTRYVWLLPLKPLLGSGLYAEIIELVVLLPQSRRAEHEADLIGLRLMARACFDPMSAPSMLAKIHAHNKKMEEREQEHGMAASILALLRTHPPMEDRVRLVESELADAQRLYEQAGCPARRADFARSARERS